MKLRLASDSDHMCCEPARAAQKLRALTLTLGSHGAGIDHADIAGFAERNEHEARRPHLFPHRLRFIRVDTAAEGIKGRRPRGYPFFRIIVRRYFSI